MATLRLILRRLSFEGLLRLFADAILINLAVLTSLAVRLLYIVAFANPQPGQNYTQLFWQYLEAYGDSAWLITLLSLIVFSASGFYTFGRFYRGRYKFLIVIQAVSISYLIFGLMAYLSQGTLFGFLKLDFLKAFLNLPSGSLVLSWLLSMVLLVTARAWSLLFRRMVNSERERSERPEERKIRNVLVIGGAGYIGSALLPKLLEKGYRVRILDLLLYGTEPIAEYMDHPHLEVLQTDFRQIDKVVQAMRDIDAVIHLGGIVGDPACALDEELTIEINLMATRMIAEVAKGSGVGHFIFASTCSVYGASDQMLDERSELNPVSLYARSKIASEKVLLQMADDRFAPVLLRFGTIYGLSGRTRFDLVINLLTAKAVIDREITIFGGDQWRPFVHVDDAARSILLVLETPLNLVRNQTFNVGSNEQNYTIRQVGEIIQSHAPQAKILLQGEDSDRRNYWVNFNKIRNSLGFVPAWTVEDGVEQVIHAIQSGKVLDYTDARYSNVKFLTEEGIFRLAKRENGWAYQLLNESNNGANVVVDA
jgi:nucleoside-diphosphate-sugar epimerase/sorbitol-specific phosphotransferase system component IIC